jgi:hypothetical protein
MLSSSLSAWGRPASPLALGTTPTSPHTFAFARSVVRLEPLSWADARRPSPSARVPRPLSPSIPSLPSGRCAFGGAYRPTAGRSHGQRAPIECAARAQ